MDTYLSQLAALKTDLLAAEAIARAQTAAPAPPEGLAGDRAAFLSDAGGRLDAQKIAMSQEYLTRFVVPALAQAIMQPQPPEVPR